MSAPAKTTPTEYCFADEAEAHTRRRALIAAGYQVSLIGFDSARWLYVFDAWTDRAFGRVEIAQMSDAQLGEAISDSVCDHDLRAVDEHTDQCANCGAIDPYDDEPTQEALLREHDLRAVEWDDDRP